MRLTLDRKKYIILKTIIWVGYLIFCLYALDTFLKSATLLYELILSAFIIELSVIRFIRSWYKNKKPSVLDWFRITTFYSLLINYFFVMKDMEDGKLWKYQNIHIDFSFAIPALITILVGLLALDLSEIIIKSIKKRNRTPLPQYKYTLRNKYLLIIFGAIILSVQLFLMLDGKMGYGTNTDYTASTASNFSFILQIISSLRIYVLLVFGFLVFCFKKEDRALKVSYYIFVALFLVAALLSGMKENVFVLVVVIAIPYFYAGNTLSTKWLVVSGLMLLVIYPLNDSYRDLLIRFPAMDKKDAIGIAFVDTYNSDFTDIFKESSNKYSDRLSLYPNLQYAIQLEPSWEIYKNMDRFPYLPISFLPRFLVPSKPMSDTGMILNKFITGSDRSSQTATTFGWAYLEGGIYFVFIEFIILGIIISLFQYSSNRNSFLFLLFLGDLTVSMLKIEADIYFLLATFIQDFTLYFILTNLFVKKTKLLT